MSRAVDWAIVQSWCFLISLSKLFHGCFGRHSDHRGADQQLWLLHSVVAFSKSHLEWLAVECNNILARTAYNRSLAATQTPSVSCHRTTAFRFQNMYWVLSTEGRKDEREGVILKPDDKTSKYRDIFWGGESIEQDKPGYVKARCRCHLQIQIPNKKGRRSCWKNYRNISSSQSVAAATAEAETYSASRLTLDALKTKKHQGVGIVSLWTQS